MRFQEREPTNVRLTVPASITAAESESHAGHTHETKITPADPHATLRAALYAGFIGAVLCTVPFVANFVLALPFAGFLSVLFYRRWTHGIEPTRGMAFKLGALTGIFAFVGALVAMALSTLTSRGQSAMRDTMLEALRQQRQRATEPQARQVIDYFSTQQGMVVMMIVGFLFMAIAFVLLSGAGASLSAFLLRRKEPPIH